jgi:hypothetical protein
MLSYASGDDIMAGDRVQYWGEPGEVECVVQPAVAQPELDWYLQTYGPGAMVIEPKVFGRVYVTEPGADGKLVLLARAHDTSA